MIYSAGKLSVLIVEEDPGEQFIMENTINEINRAIDVDLLRSGQQLIDFLFKDKIQRDLNRQTLPDLVLVNMHGDDSELDSVEKIRKNQKFKNLPIYLFAQTKGDSDQNRRAKQKGATAIYEKPCTAYDLKPLLTGILHKARLRYS